jgi:acyl carrier protein
MAIEREFDVYFTAKQVADLTSVAAILSLLEEKIK